MRTGGIFTGCELFPDEDSNLYSPPMSNIRSPRFSDPGQEAHAHAVPALVKTDQKVRFWHFKSCMEAGSSTFDFQHGPIFPPYRIFSSGPMVSASSTAPPPRPRPRLDSRVFRD